MTTKEWAQKINGREYRNELTRKEALEAEKDGVIIAFGYSDDLLELMGVVDEEVDALNGINFGFVEAIWSPKDEYGDTYASWLIESKFPHEHFSIYEDEELYCIGAVIKIKPQSLDEEFHNKLLSEGFYIIDSVIYNKENKIMKEETVNYLLEDLSGDDVIKILKTLVEE